MIIMAIYLFRQSTYQILTIATPFAFVEFLQIKYDKIFLSQEYFLIFLVLSLLCIIFKAHQQKRQIAVKILLSVIIVFQLVMGYVFLRRSFLKEEQDFAKILFNPAPVDEQSDNMEMADYINALPQNAQILMDDAIAYPVVAFSHHAQRFTLPYQETYLRASEAPEHYVNYILIATDSNPLTGYTQLNTKYIPLIKHSDDNLNLQRVYETNDWILYKVL
jgi:hypothetical protein